MYTVSFLPSTANHVLLSQYFLLHPGPIMCYLPISTYPIPIMCYFSNIFSSTQYQSCVIYAVFHHTPDSYHVLLKRYLFLHPVLIICYLHSTCPLPSAKYMLLTEYLIIHPISIMHYLSSIFSYTQCQSSVTYAVFCHKPCKRNLTNQNFQYKRIKIIKFNMKKMTLKAQFNIQGGFSV